MSERRSPLVVGVALALGAALLFGASTPFLQRAGRNAGPFATATLLYTGAAFAAFAFRSMAGRSRRKGAPIEREAPLRIRHVPRLLAVAALGAFVAPAALAWGLQRASGIAASLVLNVEAAFTIALGALVHREHVGRRAIVAAACIGAGGAILVVERGGSTVVSLALGAVVLATAAWALDNTLSRPLADLDPTAVVAAKSTLGAALSFGLALALGEEIPTGNQGLALLACGAAGYGLSLRFYLAAQRRLGAGRTASVFATAPFFGAAVAFSLGETATVTMAGGALLMLAGAVLHITEKHAHEHRHVAVEHEHAHRHDDEHHGHTHDAMPDGEHSHVHRHEPLLHRHPHAPDLHHQHDHAEHAVEGGAGSPEEE